MIGGNSVELRTAAWYGDTTLTLEFPETWNITVHWPQTPVPLTETDIAAALEAPVGQPPIRELCRGKTRPVVIVDDLNRPTPAAAIVPHLLRHFSDAGIPAESVTFLIAPGTHGRPPIDAPAKKLGELACRKCRVIVHDCHGPVVRMGRTALGTPVLVNRAVAESDFVIGIGGVYPNYTAGFGGGVKIVLGALGWRSILHLHYAHRGMAGRPDPDNSFRRDLEEIAAIVGLQTTISLHVNADRRPVRIGCGEPRAYYREAVAFTLAAFAAPGPGDADVIISNAYPSDLSLLFSKMKGFSPLRQGTNRASRVAIAPCPEGVGYHGLFPDIGHSRLRVYRDHLRRLRVLGPRKMASKAFHAAVAKLRTAADSGSRALQGQASQGGGSASPPRDVLVYRPQTGPDLPPGIPVFDDWAAVIAAIQRDHGGRSDLRVVVYPCAPLQCTQTAAATATQAASRS